MSKQVTWSTEQIEEWYLLHQAYGMDTLSVQYYNDLDRRRYAVQCEMVQHLNSFLDGDKSMREFNRVFQRKTQAEWNVFGLRGMSGGMFLNKLIKYVPDEEGLAQSLRIALSVPKDSREGQRRMQAFAAFLNELILAKQVTRSQLQPARIPFLLSAWWHLQIRERWPIFYLEVRHALMPEQSLLFSSQSPIEDYFEFRTRFLSLTKALGISPWELEHLSLWSGQQTRSPNGISESKEVSSCQIFTAHTHTSSVSNRCRAVIEPKRQNNAVDTNHKDDPFQEEDPNASRHTHLQWLLAKIGLKVGCQVWIASNDHGKVWKQECLGDLSLPSLPILTGSEFQRIIGRIDVLWLQHNGVVAAYEIERTTDITTGLLRLYDLGALSSQQQVYLCVVTPKDRVARVQFELSRPTFYGHDLRRHCAIIDEEMLLKHGEHILRWASSL